MAHVGQELALEAVGPVGRVLGGLHGGFGALAVGDVDPEGVDRRPTVAMVHTQSQGHLVGEAVAVRPVVVALVRDQLASQCAVKVWAQPGAAFGAGDGVYRSADHVCRLEPQALRHLFVGVGVDVVLVDAGDVARKGVQQ